MTVRIILAAFLVIAACMPASARGDGRSFSHFATKACKTSTCFSKHPGGRYTFPFHHGRRQ